MTTAAFLRVEGPLVRRPVLAAAAWMAANQQQIGSRLARLGAVAAAAPLALASPWQDRTLSTRMAWMSLRGATRDRLEVLGREYYDEQLLPHVDDTGRRLLTEARRQGHRVILITTHLDVIAQRLADDLDADEILCNRLEMRNERTTGRLLDPVLGGFLPASWLNDWAATRQIDLTQSLAYASTEADAGLLGAVGRPCVVRPELSLRRLARDHDWPEVEG